MRIVGIALEQLGHALMWAGGVAYLGVSFSVVMSGSWPPLLEPVRTWLETENLPLGPVAFVLGLFAVLAPGFLIALAGKDSRDVQSGAENVLAENYSAPN